MENYTHIQQTVLAIKMSWNRKWNTGEQGNETSNPIMIQGMRSTLKIQDPANTLEKLFNEKAD